MSGLAKLVRQRATLNEQPEAIGYRGYWGTHPRPSYRSLLMTKCTCAGIATSFHFTPERLVESLEILRRERTRTGATQAEKPPDKYTMPRNCSPRSTSASLHKDEAYSSITPTKQLRRSRKIMVPNISRLQVQPQIHPSSRSVARYPSIYWRRVLADLQLQAVNVTGVSFGHFC